MDSFRICIHVLKTPTTPGPDVFVAGRAVQTLALRPDAIGAPFEVSFEQAVTALGALPRMFIEPDGSFVWVSPGDEPRWQVDGCLFDRNDKLLYVELQGNCPTEAFDQFLRAVGWPETVLAFQLVRQAVFVGEREFREIAFNG